MSINRCFRGKQFFSFHNSKYICFFLTKMNLHSKQRKNDLEFNNLVLTAQSDFPLGSKKDDNHHYSCYDRETQKCQVFIPFTSSTK